MKLYEISTAIRQLTDVDASDTGELAPDAEKQLDALGLLLEQKIDLVCRVIREQQAQAEVFRAEAQRLQARAAVHANAAERLKAYVKQALESLDMKSIKTELFAVRIQRNGQPSIKLECDPEKLPVEFQQFTCEPNRKAILEAWKADPVSLPVGVTCEVGTHLRIA